jgi:hypothetical protein
MLSDVVRGFKEGTRAKSEAFANRRAWIIVPGQKKAG